jgi:hypothetical protein
MTVLAPDLADLHERTPDATCLYAADGVTCCQQPATHRVAFTGLSGATFACAEHVLLYRAHPAVLTIREVRP